jgi:hypothetical protein
MPVPPSQTLNFSWTLGDHAVLQRAPAIAAVYGFLGTATHTGDATVSVTVTPDGDDDSVEAYTVVANVTAEPVTGSTWKALLKPMASKAGQTFTITATCTTGCTGSATIKDVVFGEVWYCAGQSECPRQRSHPYTRTVLSHDAQVILQQAQLLVLAMMLLLTCAHSRLINKTLSFTQSSRTGNMALPVGYTYHQNKSRDDISAGKYHNIRLQGLKGAS